MLSFQRLFDLHDTWKGFNMTVLRARSETSSSQGEDEFENGEQTERVVHLLNSENGGLQSIGELRELAQSPGSWMIDGVSARRFFKPFAALDAENFKKWYWETLAKDDGPLRIRSDDVKEKLYERLVSDLRLSPSSNLQELSANERRALESFPLKQFASLLCQFYDGQTASYPITKHSPPQTGFLKYHIRNGKASCTNFELLGLLTEFRPHRATDPRDKVYSFLGMTSERVHIQIDYETDFTSVFQDVAKCVIDAGLSQIFAAVEANYDPRRAGKNLPSWAPDWSAPPTYNAKEAM
jgi:hypothetical protein